MTEKTTNYLVELKGDLICIKDNQGQLLKAFCVPVYEAVERFKATVAKCKEIESKKK